MCSEMRSPIASQIRSCLSLKRSHIAFCLSEMSAKCVFNLSNKSEVQVSIVVVMGVASTSVGVGVVGAVMGVAAVSEPW